MPHMGAGPGGTGSGMEGAGIIIIIMGGGGGGGDRAPPLADEGDGGLDLVKAAQEEGGVPACVTEPDPELEGFFVVGEAVLFLGGVCCEGKVRFWIGCGGEGRKEGRTPPPLES